MNSKISKKKIIKKKDIEKFLKTLAEQKSWSLLRQILNNCCIDNKEKYRYNHNIDELAKIIAIYQLKNKNKSNFRKFNNLKINPDKIK